MDHRLILVTLLIRLGVAAAISSVLVRARRFRVLLFREERTLSEKLEIVFIVGTPIALGVLVRHWVRNFYAADIAFEGAILMGVIGGRLVGTAGRRAGLAAVAVSGRVAYAADVCSRRIRWPGCCATSRPSAKPSGRSRRCSTSASITGSGAAFASRSSTGRPRSSSSSSALEFVRIQLHRACPRRIFALDSPNWWVKLAIYAGTVMAVAIALKVLNNVRIEMKLEQQERLLLQARMEALQSQINPHFLFNTLNSVSSLVRRDPDSAREMIVKLGNILRRLLRKGDSFVPLREEFEFLDDYLDIEVARFGRDKLQSGQGTRARLARPSGAQHDPAAAGGERHQARLCSTRSRAAASIMRSRCAEHRLVIEVEDDGVGMAASARAHRQAPASAW